MRGRKPRALTIPATDRAVLHWIADNPNLPDYQRERAQMVLALVEGRRIQDMARAFRCAASTVWRVCRRYEHGGLTALLADGRRNGGDPEPTPEPFFPAEQINCAV
jgi:hypothetical protein